MANEPAYNVFKLPRGAAPILQFETADIPEDDPASGWTVAYFIRATAVAPELALEVAGTWNSAKGSFDVGLTRAQTRGLAAGTYVGALWRTDSGNEDMLSSDTITVVEGVYAAP